MGILDDNVNKSAVNSGGGIGLQNDEIVMCMLLEKDVPSNFRKQWNEQEQKKKDEAETLGELYEPKPPSYKEGGVSWKIVVIKRNIKLNQFGEATKGDLVFTPKDGKLEVPKYRVMTQFQHLPPDKIQHITSKNGVKYGNMFSKAGSNEIDKNGQIIIANMYPSVYAVKENDPNVAWNDRVSADSIPLGMEDKYAGLIEKDQMRKEEWRTHINKFKELDEIGVEEYFDTAISRRLMLCEVEELAEENATPKVYFHKPMPGMKFVCKITKSGKYFNPVVLATEKDGKAYVNVNYGNNIVKPPTDPDKKIAQAILDSYEEHYSKLSQERLKSKQEDEEEEDKF